MLTPNSHNTGSPALLRGAHRPDLIRDECLADILCATVARRPDHPALIWQQRRITYAELDAASAAFAGALVSRGAAPGKVVGLFMPRGADLLIAQAGITRSGAAWLPFDAETPVERIKACLHSAQAIALVTTAEWMERLGELGVPVWAAEAMQADAATTPVCPTSRPEDPAYVIYTSGSTGQPKGIVISQRSICHFLRSENELLGINENDRVYQGFSVAFDMSFEEIWISYLVGATLWIAPPALVGDPELLAQTLARERITVLHAVPTLIGLIDDALAGLRIINLGGEACPEALARRLVRDSRKVFNTYGPTETSVTATLAELKPAEPVTIGTPLPNYGIVIVDEQHQPVTIGEQGELAIFGPGLAVGYLGRPDLTADKFIANPVAATGDEQRLYLTGDLARLDPDGLLHCLGRVDNQVKIRGFRVELDEISAVLAAQRGVGAAAVVMRPIAGVDRLVAFVAPAVNQAVDVTQLRQALSEQLPDYMLPTHIEVLLSLPRLASGKVDARSLRIVELHAAAMTAVPEPHNEEEKVLYQALAELFPGSSWQADWDFFYDLGGNSLLVARLVSKLRTDPRYASLSIQTIYRERRLSDIARAMQEESHRARPTAAKRAPAAPLRQLLCGLGQALFIPLFVLIRIGEWLAPFFVYHYYTGDPGDSIVLATTYSLVTFVTLQIGTFFLAIAGKWLSGGSLAPGRYPLWGFTYFRWWLAGKFCMLPHLYLLAGTPWMSLYLRALGARVGRDVLVETITLGAPDLLTLGDGVTVGTFVNIENARVENGMLVVGPVTLGRNAAVDSYSVLEDGTSLSEGARLCGLSALAAGQHIPAGETWEGAPARKQAGHSEQPLPARPQPGAVWKCLQAALFAATSIAVAVVFFIPSFPAFMLIDWIDAHTLDVFDSDVRLYFSFLLFFVLAIPASAILIATTVLLSGALRWLLPRQRAGLSSVYSYAYWRKRFMSLILDHSLQVLHGIYASVYAPLWMRMMGSKVGRHAEVSTAEGMTPELLELGDDSFIADGALLGDEEQRDGWMVLKPTRIGSRSFVGNGAYVQNGAFIPDDVLIGVQSRTPENEQLASGQTWLGSPAMLLPARECLQGFPEELTFRPSPLRRLMRGLVEGLRIVVPLALIIAAGYLIVILVLPVAIQHGWGLRTALALSLAGCLYGLGSFLLVVVLKWALIGRYRPCAKAMWTSFVWISEAITNLYESLAVPNLLEYLRGTPYLPWALRLLGTSIGKGVYLNTTDITEFDCVHIGDGAALNESTGPQTHLFEDRVMKIGVVHIGAGVTVGTRSIVLYDASVGDGVVLGPLTLVAKGEQLPPGTRWEGAPAMPLGETRSENPDH